MADFEFIKNPTSGKWVVSAPRRSKRTNVGDKGVVVCPFCPGKEAEEEELYRVGGQAKDSNWNIRVIPNKFPFTPHHELILHSPDHHKNFDELPFEQVELILQTYRARYNTHKNDGQVYIFHNRGHAAGESLPHPHTQLAVVPEEVHLDITPLDMGIYGEKSGGFSLFRNQPRKSSIEVLETDNFFLFCPQTSEWSDEVWVAPRRSHTVFGDMNDAEIKDLAFVMARIIQIYDIRYGSEFPFNFYIAPFRNWYFKLIPRLKTWGGFEVGTKIIVNTQDPKETFAFIKEHFWEPNNEKIKKDHQAEYITHV